MPENYERRPFATGSKPGPDAVDHYLEEKGFYRKHVARDASSLFRVVSEQVYDIQNYHEKIRQDCAGFMEARAKEYSNEVDKNFYNYINLLRRNRTHGTLLELRVLAKMYKKNVILFEPTQSLQTTNRVYVQNDSYDKNPLRVFYSHKDKHFDVIYTMDYVEQLAECQAIVYSILYQSVFKLPDVQYAVERMLHDQDEQLTLPLPEDDSKYKTQAGEVIAFDSHEDTNCVLKDPRTCHFHNQITFYEVFNENKDAITVINRTDETGGLKIYKLTDGFLHDMDKSCVRQLLEEKITPFPYKVAKALDPSIYRNTEFELWSEKRKEQRLKWLDSDFPSKQLEEKWFMHDTEKFRRNAPYNMRKYGDQKFEQAIVDEKGYMAMDDEMKKKYVILDPSAEPFKFNNFSNFDHFIPSKDMLEMTVMPANVYRGGYKKSRGGARYNNSYNNHNAHHHPNSPQQYMGNSREMPHVGEIEREGKTQDQQDQQVFHTQSQGGEINNQEQFAYEQANQQMYQQIPSPYGYGGQILPYIPQQHQFLPHQGQPIQNTGPLSFQQMNVMPYGNFSIPPPVTVVQAASPISSMQEGGDTMHIMRESELASTSINWKPRESTEQGGADLPLSDVPTLQFYYNLGVRYFLMSGVQRRLESVANQLETLDINENVLANEHHSKSDPPPVPTNTPVTTKPISSNYGPPGKSYSNNPHGKNLRPFNNSSANRDNNRENIRDNRDGHRGGWNNSRKEIKFNSNVKNLHKNESKVGSDHNAQCFNSNQQQHFGSSNRNDASTSTSISTQDKHSPTSGTSVPQFSPILHEPPQMPQYFQHQAQVMQEHVQPQQQYYQPLPSQPYIQQQQQGITMVYQVNEDGCMMQPVPQQIPYPPPYQFIQPQPMYFPVNYQQMDGSNVSNDSGVVDSSVYTQYYQPSPVPIYYTQSPLPQTPQMTQVAPVFPVAQLPPNHPQGIPVIAQIPLGPQHSDQSISTVSASEERSTDNAT